MNKEMAERFREAKKYEKMAIRALFSERAVKHLEVIEEEVKSMLKECVMDMAAEEINRRAKADAEKEPGREKDSNVKKVNIS